jgi:serine/threonine protein kinase
MSWDQNDYKFTPNQIFGSSFIHEKQILSILKDLSAGLYFLHNEAKIIHRDIKP